MKRIFATVVFFLILFFVAACNITQQTIPTAVPTSTPVPPTPTLVPAPNDPAIGGFYYYEDPTKEAGYDPLFAVCNGSVIRLMQNGSGWDYTKISREEFGQYRPLNNTGQTSDRMGDVLNFYKYNPETGDVILENQNKTVVQGSLDELKPDYWIWAWTSLVFMKTKDCMLRIYYINPNDIEAVPIRYAISFSE